MEDVGRVMTAPALKTAWPVEDRLRVTWDRLALGLLVLASIEFFVSTAIFSARSPLWMDEILAVWTARQPSAGAIIRALESGSEFSPPVFHLLLHQLMQFGVAGKLSMRAPSIIAAYVTGLCVFELVRRRYAVSTAALAMTACLVSGLSFYAVQARPYTLVTACFTMALVLWDVPAERRPCIRSAAAIGLLLALAIGAHFYALLLAGSLGLAELIWTAVHKRVRWLHLIAIALACSSILIWLPILRHATVFNAGDVSSPSFYARPTLLALIASYVDVLLGHTLIWASPFTVLIGVGIVAMLINRGENRPAPSDQEKDLNLIVAVTCLIPVIVFVFSALVTHAFSGRYAIAGALGCSILIARCAAAMPRPQMTCCLLIGVLLVGAAFPIRSATDLNAQTLEMLRRAPGGLPIATDDGLRFFELREGAAADVASRLIYVVKPDSGRRPDLTNQHQVLRWAAIDPAIKAVSAAAFLGGQSKFLIFSHAGGDEILPKIASDHGFSLTAVNRVGATTLYLASRPIR